MTTDDKRQVMDRFTLNVNMISLAMRLLSYLNDQVFCWNDLLNVGTSDVWKYLNDKKFVQILPLHEHHYVAISNLQLSTEEINTIYIFDPCIEFSYREMDNDIKYPISFIKTCCNFLRKTQRKISFKLMNVCRANSLPSNGYYVVMYAYTLFCNLDIFSLKVSQENISSNIISFFETNEIPSFQCLPLLHETKPDVYMDFQETLYCHCRGPDLRKSMKQCNRCLDWFQEDCESFDDIDQNVFPNHWFDRYCIGIHLLPREILEAIFLELCIAREEMHLILSLVCKRWSEIVNKNFRDRVHIAWLDREFNANNWNEETKRKYRVPFRVLKCLNCNHNFKPEIGYWRDPRDCTAIYGGDNHISGYCSECEASCSTWRF